MQSSILLHKIVELDLEPPHLYGRQKAQVILGRKEQCTPNFSLFISLLM